MGRIRFKTVSVVVNVGSNQPQEILLRVVINVTNMSDILFAHSFKPVSKKNIGKLHMFRIDCACEKT